MEHKQYGVIVANSVMFETDDIDEAHIYAQDASKIRPAYVVEFHQEYIDSKQQY